MIKKKKQALQRLSNLGVEYTAPTALSASEAGIDGIPHDQRKDYCVSIGNTYTITDPYSGMSAEYQLITIGVDANGQTLLIFADGLGELHTMGPDGQLNDALVTDCYGSEYMYEIRAAYQDYEFYSSVYTDEATALQMGLPEPGTLEKGSIEDFDNIEFCSLVNYGQPNASDVSHVTSNDELHTAITSLAPVITLDASQVDFYTEDGSTSVTLVYDNDTRMYYQLSENGTYTIDLHSGMKPSDIKIK